LVQEGDQIHQGQLIALMDDQRYAASLAAAQAQAANEKQVLAAMLAGSRPEQIVQAKAQMDGLAPVVQNDAKNYQRNEALLRTRAVSRQQRDDAKAAYDTANQNYQAARQAYILAVKGPRKEDIAAAQASYQAATAQGRLAAIELRDTKLYAPAGGVIESRILEPGDMASPQTPVYTIALANPLWVRAYVPETSLGKITPGMAASITTDSYPGKVYHGWVGYLSPTAEFTPQNVETPDLRAELVYQLRVYTCDAASQLRLGMPATVTLDLTRDSAANAPRGPDVCGGDAAGN
jgi:HlyD family secretion protein